jgi:hypothetical protein
MFRSISRETGAILSSPTRHLPAILLQILEVPAMYDWRPRSRHSANATQNTPTFDDADRIPLMPTCKAGIPHDAETAGRPKEKGSWLAEHVSTL